MQPDEGLRCNEHSNERNVMLKRHQLLLLLLMMVVEMTMLHQDLSAAHDVYVPSVDDDPKFFTLYFVLIYIHHVIYLHTTIFNLC